MENPLLVMISFILEMDEIGLKAIVEEHINMYEEMLDQFKNELPENMYNQLFTSFLNTKAWVLRKNPYRYDEALSYIEKAIELSETEIVNFYDTKAYILCKQEKYQDALELYTKCIDEYDNSYYRICRGDIYKEMGNFEMAKADYSKAIELFDKNILSNYTIGEGIEFLKNRIKRLRRN